MQIYISKIKSEGLRCPDMEFVFNNNISLLQMPNGTGKTTLLELTKRALSGKAFTSKEVSDLKDPNASKDKGIFELELKLTDSKKEAKITIRNEFSFDKNMHLYSTHKDEYNRKFLDSDVSEGFILSYAPPSDIKPFLLEEIVDLFVLEGSYVKSLLNDSSDQAERAINAFTGINYLKEARGHVDRYYKKVSVKGNAPNEAKIEKLKQTCKELENWISQVEKSLEKKKRELQEKKEQSDKLKVGIKTSQLDKEELDKLNKAEEKAKGILRSASEEFFQRLQNPIAINNQVRLGLNEFNKTLGRLKLPGDATESFFNELCEDPECICGNQMTEQMVTKIKKNSKIYLSGEWQGSLNKVKRDIKNLEVDISENPMEETINAYKEARANYEAAHNEVIKYETVQTGNTDKNLHKLVEKVDKLSSQIRELEIQIKDITKDDQNPIKDIIKSFNPLYLANNINIPDLKRIQKYHEDKLADAQGNKKLKNTADLLKKLLEDSEELARQNINKKIVAGINSKIDSLLIGDDSLKVKDIKGNLILSKSKASQGQSLTLAYSFVMTLLDRSNHEFPLIVDHPFEGIQEETRNEISQALPNVCNQYLGFLINSEKLGSIKDWDKEDQGFRLTDAKISYITAFRKTKTTKKIIEETDKKILLTTRNGALSYDEGFFDNFRINKE